MKKKTIITTETREVWVIRQVKDAQHPKPVPKETNAPPIESSVTLASEDPDNNTKKNTDE